MFKTLSHVLKSFLIYGLEKIGGIVNQLPSPSEKPRAFKLFSTPPWKARAPSKHEKIQKTKLRKKPKGPAHSETKIFNHPRKSI